MQPLTFTTKDLEPLLNACASNNIALLNGLFDGTLLALPPSETARRFYRDYVNDEIAYSLIEAESLFREMSGPPKAIIDKDGRLASWLKPIFQHIKHNDEVVFETMQALADFYKEEQSRCFKLVFNDDASLKPWLIDYIGEDNLALCYKVFGEVAVHYALFKSFTMTYLRQFQQGEFNQSRDDKRFSQVLCRLFEYDINHTLDFAKNQLVAISARLTKEGTSFRLYRQGQAVLMSAKMILFTRSFDDLNQFNQCLNSLVMVMDNPYQAEPLEHLRKTALDAKSRVKARPWQQFFGLLTAFVGTLLVLAGVIGTSYLSGLGFCLLSSALGVATIVGGTYRFFSSGERRLQTVLSDFADVTEKVQLEATKALDQGLKA